MQGQTASEQNSAWLKIWLKTKKAFSVFLRILRRYVWTLPPVIVFIAMMFTFKANGLYPFGGDTISWGDMDQQVIPLMSNLKDVLMGKEGFFFSFSNACGMNFFGVFFFYLSSPFSFLVVFVDKTEIASFMNVIVLLKMCTIAGTASAYFYHKHSDRPIQNVALSVLYAFSGYVMMYYQNVIWLDCVYLFPFLLWGLERLKDGKRALFIGVLTAFMAVSYYIGYMIVIFLLLYAFVYLCLEKNKRFAADFCLSCFVAALLSAVVWLPSLAQFLSSGRTESIVDSLRNSSMLAKYQTAFPTVFSILFLFPFVFSVKRKENADVNLRFYLALLTLIPVVIEPINKMWQTGNYMCFPTRYAFITIFLCLSLAFDRLAPYKNEVSADGQESGKAKVSFKTWWQENWKKEVPRYALSMVLLLAAWLYYSFSTGYIDTHKETVDQYSHSLWGNDASYEALLKLYVVAVLVGVLFYLLYRYKWIKPVCLWLGVAVMTLSELYVAPVTYMLTPAHSTDTYSAFMELSEQIDDDSFFRVKTDKSYSYSGGDFDVTHMSAMGYNALGHFTSLTSSNYMTAIKQFGYTSYWMEVGNSGGTILTDTLLSIKYQMSNKQSQTDVLQGEYFNIKPTGWYLPLGIVTKQDIIAEAESTDYSYRGELQSILYEDFFGASDGVAVYTLEDEENLTLENVKVEKKGDSYRLKPTGKGTAKIIFKFVVRDKTTVYFNAFDKNDNALKQKINEKFSVAVNRMTKKSSYPLQRDNGILTLGEYERTLMEVAVTVKEEISVRDFSVIGIDNEKLKTAVSETKSIDLQEGKNELTGTYTAAQKECVFLSVPYDSGLTLTINGEEQELYEVYDGFIGFYVNAGVNEIEISFLPSGFAIGLLLCILGAGLGVLGLVFTKKKGKKFTLPEKVETALFYALLLVGVAVVFVVYALPPILCAT